MVGQHGDGMKRFKGSSRDDYARRRRIFAFSEVQMAFVVVGLYLGGRLAASGSNKRRLHRMRGYMSRDIPSLWLTSKFHVR
jgi:hypothetical protein